MDGHAGIPQENRLLFRALSSLDEHEVQGLLQSGNRVLADGLPMLRGEIHRKLPPHEEVNRMSRVVVSLQPATQGERLDRWRRNLKTVLSPLRLAWQSLLMRRQPLSGFEPEHFRDFIWRSLFAKTLSAADIPLVTRAPLRVLRTPYGAMHAAGLLTRRFGHALYPRLDTEGVDVMIAQTPYPGRVLPGTQLIVRYMDAVPMMLPHTIVSRSFHQASHYEALRRNVRDGAYFACASEATRRDLLAMFPQAASRAVVIHCMLSHHYFAEESLAERVPEILVKRRHALDGISAPNAPMPSGSPFLLVVSTLEPRKNHTLLINAWEQLRASGHGQLKLVLVGSLGWESKDIVSTLAPWVARGEAFLMGNVSAEELRVLYRHARVTVCPSVAEGFDYSGVEAMRCGGVVAASDIPVHREVYADAAVYFDPYSVEDAANTLHTLMTDTASNTGALQSRQQRGAEVAARYLPEQLLPQWRALLTQAAATC